MHTEVSIDFAVLYSFLIVLARVSGFLVLVPLPGLSAGPTMSRIVLALTLTLSLMPLWPTVKSSSGTGDLVIWAASEFALGLVTGIGVALLLEAFQAAAQAIGLQAGFSYASTIDPSTQADTAVLQTVLQLFAGVLFFTMGFDLQLFRLLTIGLKEVPSAAALSKAFNPEAVMRFGTNMFNTALRLALPMMGFLLLLDLAFALLSKVHAQMQLLSFSFSAKMLAALALFAATLALFPAILSSAATRTMEILLRLLT
jgi:flagellar biosynthetic protein FliR